MKKTVVVGLQWGDEGKGKIIDSICKNHDIVIRFQGGNNAGHTIVTKNQEYKLSHIPSGILYSDKIAFLGTGMVIELEALFKEIDDLKSKGVDISTRNLKVADNATIIIPFYKEVDKILEASRGENKIGTTHKGIGVAYQDRAARRAIRVCDLYEPTVLEHFFQELLDFYRPLFASHQQQLPSIKELLDYFKPLSERLKGHVVNGYEFFRQNHNKKLLFEGAQGLMLDILWGTYPFVTSSQTHLPQLFNGSGIGLCQLSTTMGVMKAYTTRVGGGPFPTEDHDELGKQLQQIGKEFGTVTGRIRRCGPLDLVAAKFAATLSGINSIAITKLDVLNTLDEIPVCIAYEVNGKQIDYFPSSVLDQQNIKPIYKIFKGWNCNLSEIKTTEKLPAEAKTYIQFIEAYLNIPIDIISIGADRDETIYNKSF